MELKEIAGYLPYNLKCYTPELKLIFTIKESKPINHVSERAIADLLCFKEKFKPILRPLTNLKKEEKEELKKLLDGFGVGYKTHSVAVLTRTDLPLDYIIGKTPYNLIKKLYEWHFDIHGLIDKNEAIDMSCL